jgi:copper chaperone CopZ
MKWMDLDMRLLALLGFVLCASWGCQQAKKVPKGPPPGVKADQVTLVIQGMTCDGCVKFLTRRLNKTPGIYKAKVTLKPPRAYITYNRKQIQVKSMIASIKSGGYNAHTELKKAPSAPPASR